MTTDENSDFSLAKKATLILERDVKAPRHDVSTVLRTPKKTRLERLSLQGTTSTVMKAIRRVRVEHLAEFFEQTW